MTSSGKVNGSLAMSVVVAAKAVRARLSPLLNQVGLNAPRPLLLGVLLDHDGLTQTEIAAMMNADAPVVAKCLRGMERDGLVTRERDPLDTRVQRTKLTEKGRALGPTLEERWAEASADLFEPLTAAERKELKRILDKVSAHHRYGPRAQRRKAVA